MNGFRLIPRASVAAVLFFLLFGCGVAKRGDNLAKATIDYGALTNVTKLVDLLISPVPPKHPSGEWDITDEEEIQSGFTHPQVEAARKRLVSMGTPIYPELVKHIHDDRYSYSIVSAAWLNESVGEAIVGIMAEGISFSGYGYKGRKNKVSSNGEPSFQMMAEQLGWEEYALHASTRSKPVLQKEFVQWKLEKERAYGFTDSEQEAEITGPYIRWLKSH